MKENVMFKEEFARQLTEFEQRFDSLRPECELIVRDVELGVEGYVVVWSTLAARSGPLGRIGKGGTRITETVTLEEVSMLARQMTLKNAAAGLPLGGAKSGLRADPKGENFEKIYRRFVSLVKPLLSEHGGPFGGFGFDLGGRPQHAIWACDELKSLKSFTGKPLEMAGTDYDREGIAGYGVSIAATSAIEVSGRDVKDCSFAVQGLGAMGSAVIRHFSAMGAKLKVLSDPRLGGSHRLHNRASEQLLKAISEFKFEETQRLLQAEATLIGESEEVLFADVDILFPCAVQGVIHLGNVSRVQASMIVEGANSPCESEAQELLAMSGKIIIPDFIANPGGIIAAYVEMISTVSPEDNLRERSNPKMALKFTKEKISENVKLVYSISKSAEVSTVKAGRYLALSRMFASSSKE